MRAWLPEGARVMLSADRFHPSSDLFGWIDARGWGCRLRGGLLAGTGHGEETATGGLAQGVKKACLRGAS